MIGIATWRRRIVVKQQPVEEMLADAREVYGVFGKAQRALGIVDKALVSEPHNIEALNLKAAILYELDRNDEAADYHRRALTVEPHSVEALHGLASIANEEGEYPIALQWLEQAFQSIPKDPHPEFKENEDYRQRLIAELYNEKAFAFWYTGQRDEAVRLLSKDAPLACPLEVETFEEELDWLKHHPDTPED